jgi:hypothetical protein
MNLRTLWLSVALGAAPLVAHAQISADVSFNWSTNAPGEAVASTDVFYDQLSPYGTWIDDPVVGQAYIPDEQGYVPYTNGHWEDTDVGFVWASDEPFAWATSHYGRWWFSNDYGRWVWVPDTTWGPSWVEWYDAGDDIGWAPMAPDVVINAGYQMPYNAYHYCSGEHVLDNDVRRYYEPAERVEAIHRQARPISVRTSIGSHQVVAGPAPQRLQAHHVRAQVKHLDAKVMGRMSAPEVRAAEQRAQQRKPQIEQQNARRLQAHTELQKVVQQRATKAPQRNDANRPEPQRTDTNRPNLTTRPEPNRGDTNRGEPNRAEGNRAEPNRAEPNRGDTNRAEPNRGQPNRPEPKAVTPRPEPQRAAPVRPEPPRAEPARPDRRAEPTRPEPPRAEPTRVEPKRPEPTRAEPARPEPTRAEPARPEPTRAEPARPEPQRAEPPRPEPQRAEPARPERAEPPRAEPQHAAPPAARPEPASRGDERGRDKTDDRHHH